MCEPNRTPATQPHAEMVDAARALLAQADGMMDPARPWIEIPTTYEVAALVERRFTAIGHAETQFDKYLRIGAIEAAHHIEEACRALERAWIDANPPRLTRTVSPLPEAGANHDRAV